MLQHQPGPHQPLRLRRVAVWSFPLALVLFLHHGFSSGDHFPAVGLVPLTASAAHSAAKLYPALRPGALRNLPYLWSPHTTVVVDSVLAYLHGLATLVSLVRASTVYHSDTHLVILATYCTVFLIAVGSIHVVYAAYYGLRHFNESMEHLQRLAARERKHQLPQDSVNRAEKSIEHAE